MVVFSLSWPKIGSPILCRTTVYNPIPLEKEFLDLEKRLPDVLCSSPPLFWLRMVPSFGPPSLSEEAPPSHLEVTVKKVDDFPQRRLGTIHCHSRWVPRLHFPFFCRYEKLSFLKRLSVLVPSFFFPFKIFSLVSGPSPMLPLLNFLKAHPNINYFPRT